MNNNELRISTGRQQELLADVALLQKQRAESELELTGNRDQQTAECNATFDRETAELKSTFDDELKDLDEQYVRGLETARHRFESESGIANEEATSRRDRASTRFRESFDAGELSWRQTRALTIDNFESEKKTALEIGDQTKVTLDGYEEQLTWLEDSAGQMLKRRGFNYDDDVPKNLNLENSTATLLKSYSASASRAHNMLQNVSGWRSVKFLDDGWPLLIFFGTFILSIFPSGFLLGWTSWHWFAVSAGAAMVAAVGSRQVMHWFVRSKTRQPLHEMHLAVTEAAGFHFAGSCNGRTRAATAVTKAGTSPRQSTGAS